MLRRRATPSAFCLTAFFLLSVSTPAVVRAVVIHEIHYNPPEGSLLEFVELYNPHSEAVSLEGWRLQDGIDFTFPAGATIAGSGFVVVCKDPERLISHFQLPTESQVFGGYGGRLANSGERLELVSDTDRVIDSVRYSDSAPWDDGADGEGASLQRRCARFEPVPHNFLGQLGAVPTPLAQNAGAVCPPPSPPPAPITFHEIHYHPPDDDVREEFVELKNNTDAAIPLAGYRIRGIDYTFGDDAVLAPGGLLAVARDPDHLAMRFSAANVVGGLTGDLSNGGENLVLLDPTGAIVDSVRFRDHGLWPAGSDGTGRSLEKIVAEAPSNDPAAWRAAAFPDAKAWNTVEIEGPLTRSRFHFYIFGAGEALIDDFRLTILGTPAGEQEEGGPAVPDELRIHHDFNEGLSPWTFTGNHEMTRWVADGDPDGGGAVHLISEGFGSAPRSAGTLEIEPEIARNTPVRVSFRWRHLSGSTLVTSRLSSSTSTRGVYWRYGSGSLATPGTPNTVEASQLPPVVAAVRRAPQEPRSEDTTWIRAAVHDRAAATTAMFLEYQINSGPATRIPMLDDGNSSDGTAGDGDFGAAVPPQPHNTIVTFRILAQDSGGKETPSPLHDDPTGYYAYYINDLQPESDVPVYTLLVDHTGERDPRAVMNTLSCITYRPASFSYRGDVYYDMSLRARGQSVCGSAKKYLKARFERGNFFRGLRKLNFQSLWTDKSLIRERLSWDTFDAMGAPNCEHGYVRLHVNGEYFGLYAELEHPDSRYLERNGLDPSGNLYKAVASTEQKQANYANGYEKKTNEDRDFSDLKDFLDTMHSTANEDLVDFFSARVDEDGMIEYLTSQVLTGNVDFPHKNHYLYHDPGSGRWLPTTWDMDLTYGKTWSGEFGGVLNDKMFTPGASPWVGMGNQLLSKFFRDSGDWYRRAYFVRLWDALREKRPVAFYDEEIDSWRDFLYDEQADDFEKWGRSPATRNDPEAPAEFDPNLERVRGHVRTRQEFLLDFLRDNEGFVGHDRMKITEVMYNPPQGQDTEFIELWNVMPTAVDASGWSVAGVDYEFPAGTVVEAGEIFVLARDPDAFRAAHAGVEARVLGPYSGALSNSGETLRLRDAGPGFPATVDFLAYDNTGEWPRRADGLGASLEWRSPGVGADNDSPALWRASLSGGTPGVIPEPGPAPVRFRRGDVNGDGRYNLVDGLVVLRYLAGTLEEPACAEAFDVDGSGAEDLTDAVFLLNFVFIKNSPAPPFPGPRRCGVATAGRCEASNCE